MANEGSKYLKNKTKQELRKMFLNYVEQSKKAKEFQLAKLNSDRTKGTLPDGTNVDVTAIGFPGNHEVVANTSRGRVVTNRVINQNILDGKKERAFIIERYDGILYIREVGNLNKYPLPQTLNSNIDPDQYTAGFSSNGDMLFIGGNYSENCGRDVYAVWQIYRGIDIDSEGFKYTSLSSGSENIGENYAEFVKPEVEPPDHTGGVTPGLAGEDRNKNIWKFWADPIEDIIDYSPEEILQFINDLIEFFELTEEEVEILFPGGVESAAAAAALQDRQENRFFPIIDIEYDTETLPTPVQVGSLDIVSDTQNGFYSKEWEIDPDHKPVVIEVGFVFNNNTAGDPVLDIITTYKSVTVYRVSNIEFETVVDWDRVNFPSAGGYIASINQIFKRANREEYSYTYSSNFPFSNEEGELLTITASSLEYNSNITNVEAPGYNFKMTVDSSIVGGGTSAGSPEYIPSGVEYYPVLFFNEYHFAIPDALTQCHGNEDRDPWPATWGPKPDPTGCAYYKQLHEPYVVTANNPVPTTIFIYPSNHLLNAYRFVTTGNSWFVLYHPPDNVTYNATTYDGTTTDYAALGIAPQEPTFFVNLDPRNEPLFGGFFVNEDLTVWPAVDPFAQVYQFGRGVMAIKNANGSKEVTYIDRPPAQSRDYDTIVQSYLGVNGTRSLVVKEDYYDAYGYAQDYVDTTNQIVELNRPDITTDVYYIPEGVWPFPYDGLKAVNSQDFVQYHTEQSDGITTEYVKNIFVDLDGSTTTEKQRSGVVPPGALDSDLIDFVIKGSEYV